MALLSLLVLVLLSVVVRILSNEYVNLDLFDRELASTTRELNSSSSSLRYANVALLYLQRSEQWRLGGDLEAMEFMNKALNTSSKGASIKLLRAMTYQKAVISMRLGLKDKALSCLDSILQKNHTRSRLSMCEVSSVLYQKATLLFTLFDDPIQAFTLLDDALLMCPCNTDAYLQFVQALHASGTIASRAVWLQLLGRFETDMKRIIALEDSSVVYITKTKNGSSFNVTCTFKERFRSVFSPVPSQETSLSIDAIRATLFWTMHVCAEQAGRFDLSFMYLQQARHLDKSQMMMVAHTDYSALLSLQRTKRLVTSFGSGFWSYDNKAMGSQAKAPLFIVGFSQSGSTLLEQMLSLHANVTVLKAAPRVSYHSQSVTLYTIHS